ncbi:hypothetical protein PFNF54_02293 [Plasmodium falciparum NF54]|uniref:Uncharacterized protein n=1 Tax=Plasmodium falciparum (isolate NF54) TaxID=5843 RepID=W7JVH6_PLAFO|nr:hypothetical protein PFNF54_02293 [Plasmodium falciparum NF54]
MLDKHFILKKKKKTYSGYMECFNLIDKHDIKKYNIDQIQFSSHINKKKNKMSYIYSISISIKYYL